MRRQNQVPDIQPNRNPTTESLPTSDDDACTTPPVCVAPSCFPPRNTAVRIRWVSFFSFGEANRRDNLVGDHASCQSCQSAPSPCALANADARQSGAGLGRTLLG